MPSTHVSKEVARGLILDEMFDLALYQGFRTQVSGESAVLLDDLIEVEEQHVQFWKTFFEMNVPSLNLLRTIKLHLVLLVSRFTGETGMHMVLEGIEIYGVKKYLDLWSTSEDPAFRDAVRQILQDELDHEDAIVHKITSQKLNPQKIRDFFLGFNDGSVEILGAVSGFAAAFSQATSVAIAGLTVAAAGCISMGAGAFVATRSEEKVRAIEVKKACFVEQEDPKVCRIEKEQALSSGLRVAFAYFIGAAVPVLPFVLGAETIWWSVGFSGLLIVLVSGVLAFLSGMSMRRHAALNLVIITGTVAVTYLIGRFVASLLGVSI